MPELLLAKKTELEQKKLSAVIETEWYDLTIPGKPKELGKIHRITQAKKEIFEILKTFGFIELQVCDSFKYSISDAFTAAVLKQNQHVQLQQVLHVF